MLFKSYHVRPRGWFSLFVGHYGWLVVVTGVSAAVLFAIAVPKYWSDVDFVTDGIATEAEIVSYHADRMIDPTATIAVVRYATPDGTFEGRRDVDSLYPILHKVGDTVEILYLPDSPAQFFWAPQGLQSGVARDDPVGASKTMLTLAAFFSALSALLGAFAAWRATSAVMARRYGRNVIGEVREIKVIRGEYRTDTKLRHVIYRDDLGRTFKSMPKHSEDLTDLHIGAQVRLFRGKGRSWWDADVGQRPTVPKTLPRVIRRRDQKTTRL